MNNHLESLEHVSEKIIPDTNNIINWFSQPKEDARQYLIDTIKDNEFLSPQEASALIFNSRKLVREYANCKSIFEGARKKFEKNANINQVDSDWSAVFFDKARLVNKKEMQIIWSNILAQEVNAPGCINPSLLHTLSVMTYNQAEFFCNITRFCLKSYKTDTINPLIFYSTNVIAYNSSGIDDKKLRELHHLGLIEYSPQSEFIFDKKAIFTTGTKVITIYGDPKNQSKIKAGNVIFTSDGQTLYSIVDGNYKKYRQDILDFTIKKFLNRGCSVNINGNDIRY